MEGQRVGEVEKKSSPSGLPAGEMWSWVGVWRAGGARPDYSRSSETPPCDEPACLAACELSDTCLFLVFFPRVSENLPQLSNGQQQHCQHSTSQEAGGTAEDGSQHRQDKGEGGTIHTARPAVDRRSVIRSLYHLTDLL